MEAVEINAGAWYLRTLRDDDRVSDVAALSRLTSSAPSPPADRVRDAAAGWAAEHTFTWAVCVPTTGEMVTLITLTREGTDRGRLRVEHVPEADPDSVSSGVAAVRRFARAALEMTVD